MGVFWLAAVLLMMMIAPAYANHFPEELAYLNGTALVHERLCTDEQIGGELLCSTYDDVGAGHHYIVVSRKQAILKVYRVKDKTAVIIFDAVGKKPDK